MLSPGTLFTETHSPVIFNQAEHDCICYLLILENSDVRRTDYNTVVPGLIKKRFYFVAQTASKPCFNHIHKQALSKSVLGTQWKQSSTIYIKLPITTSFFAPNLLGIIQSMPKQNPCLKRTRPLTFEYCKTLFLSIFHKLGDSRIHIKRSVGKKYPSLTTLPFMESLGYIAKLWKIPISWMHTSRGTISIT